MVVANFKGILAAYAGKAGIVIWMTAAEGSSGGGGLPPGMNSDIAVLKKLKKL